MNIISGTTTLIRNALFPAGFVLIGRLSESDFKKMALSESVQSCLSSMWQGCTLENAKAFGSSAVEFGSSIGSSIYQQTPIGPIATASTALSDYKIEIGATAVIGSAATVIDAVLKRLPVIKYHPYLRVVTSVGLATGATYYTANAFNFPVDPEMLTNIAIQVGVIGCLAKVTTTTTKVAFTVLRGSSEWVSWGFRGICSGVVYGADMLDFGSLPEGAKKVKKESKREISEEDLQLLEEVKKTRSNPSTPIKGEVRQRTPIKESPIEELEELE